MKLKLVTLAMIITLMGAVSCKKGTKGSGSSENPKLKTRMDSVSYAFGKAIGQSLKMNLSISDSTGLDYEIMKIAMQRSIHGDSSALDDMKVRMIMQSFENEQVAKQEQAMLKKNGPIIEKNEKLAAEFLSKNRTAEGVITTESGLQYKIIKAGSGAKPLDGQTTKVNYTGKLVDGSIFDSSTGRPPLEFTIGNGIPGFSEILKLIPVGTKCEVYIPPALAYGSKGTQSIPGGSLLIFEVELLSIEK